MLRYENAAQVGDTIRAYDFEPLEGRPECWIEGLVVEKGYLIPEGGVYPFKAYTIHVEHSSWPDDDRIGARAYVPFELSMDWGGRVQLIRRIRSTQRRK
jgi:hypothetical protein